MDDPQEIVIKQYAESNMEHPARVLISGKSGSGKTWLAINLILQVFVLFKPKRFIVVCPTWKTQDVFRRLDHLVNEDRDVFDIIDENTFIKIYKQLLQQVKYTKEKGIEPIKTVLLVDDCGSDKVIHGGRISNFGKLAIQLRHLDVSSIVIVQNPMLASPNYRENANHFIFFPCQRLNEFKWLHNEFNSTLVKEESFKKMIKKAWNGGKDIEEDDDESNYGKNFFYVFTPPRDRIRFYCNFETELKPSQS